jgi:hypothetical protein
MLIQSSLERSENKERKAIRSSESGKCCKIRTRHAPECDVLLLMVSRGALATLCPQLCFRPDSSAVNLCVFDVTERHPTNRQACKKDRNAGRFSCPRPESASCDAQRGSQSKSHYLVCGSRTSRLMRQRSNRASLSFTLVGFVCRNPRSLRAASSPATFRVKRIVSSDVRSGK